MFIKTGTPTTPEQKMPEIKIPEWKMPEACYRKCQNWKMAELLKYNNNAQ
jgi:hypothetical protein